MVCGCQHDVVWFILPTDTESPISTLVTATKDNVVYIPATIPTRRATHCWSMLVIIHHGDRRETRVAASNQIAYVVVV